MYWWQILVEGGFVQKHGEGKMGKKKGWQGFLERRAGSWGMRRERGHLPALQGEASAINWISAACKSENTTVLPLPGEAAAKTRSNFYIYQRISYPGTRWFLVKGEKSFIRGQWNKSGRNVKFSAVSVEAQPSLLLQWWVVWWRNNFSSNLAIL